jgi:hypothetical protein
MNSRCERASYGKATLCAIAASGILAASATMMQMRSDADDVGRWLLPSVEDTAMTFILEYAHVGETAGCSNHDHDLIAELSRRLGHLAGLMANGPATEAGEPATLPARTPQSQSFGL